ncbi:MAG: GDSL-type esterase/lipase family protein [Eubacteriales bacterium]
MNKKRFLSVLLALCTIFTLSVPALADSSAPALPKTAVLAALGDSIPAHYGLPEEQGYVAVLASLMKDSGIDTTVQNFAVSGLTTDALLAMLKKPEASVLSGADIITLSIGGNDVLGLFVDIIKSSLAGLGVSDITKLTPEIMLKLSETPLSADQLAVLQTGVKTFAANFPLIITSLRTAAPDAMLLVSTVYNPFPKDTALYTSADTVLSAINAVIAQGAGQYTVADTYNTFADATSSMVNFDLTKGITDIHPNEAGHKLIAELHMKTILAAYTTPVSEGLTRGDAVAALVGSLKAVGISAPTSFTPFADVPVTHKNYATIHAARALGIVSGIGDNLFAPDEIMSRQDFAVMSLNAVKKLTGKDAATIALVMSSTTADMNKVAGYAYDSIRAAILLGILKTDAAGNINPTAPATADLLGALSAAVLTLK